MPRPFFTADDRNDFSSTDRVELAGALDEVVNALDALHSSANTTPRTRRCHPFDRRSQVVLFLGPQAVGKSAFVSCIVSAVYMKTLQDAPTWSVCDKASNFWQGAVFPTGDDSRHTDIIECPNAESPEDFRAATRAAVLGFCKEHSPESEELSDVCAATHVAVFALAQDIVSVKPPLGIPLLGYFMNGTPEITERGREFKKTVDDIERTLFEAMLEHRPLDLHDDEHWRRVAGAEARRRVIVVLTHFDQVGNVDPQAVSRIVTAELNVHTLVVGQTPGSDTSHIEGVPSAEFFDRFLYTV